MERFKKESMNGLSPEVAVGGDSTVFGKSIESS